MDPVTGTVPGDLVSITSIGKNTFIYRSMGKAPGNSWVGLIDREGVLGPLGTDLGAVESQSEADNKLMGWKWTNGDAHTDDGIPATRETTNNLSDSNPAHAAADKDGDGLTNIQEYAAGTNPGDASSVFRITSVARTSGGTQVTLPTKAGHSYKLYASGDLMTSWTEVGLALPSANGSTSWTVPTPAGAAGRYFFRVAAEPCN